MWINYIINQLNEKSSLYIQGDVLLIRLWLMYIHMIMQTYFFISLGDIDHEMAEDSERCLKDEGQKWLQFHSKLGISHYHKLTHVIH